MAVCPECHVLCEPYYRAGKRVQLSPKVRPRKSDPRYPASQCPVCLLVLLEVERPEYDDRKLAAAGG